MAARLLLLAGALLLGGCDGVLRAALGATLVDPAAVGDPGALEIVDLQDGTAFAAGHLPGSVRVPAAGLAGYLSRAPARPSRPLLLVCTDGTASALAAPTARLYRSDVRVLAGGEEAWARAGLPVARGPAPLAGDDGPPLRVLTRAEQVVAWASGYLLRPLYVVVALLLVRMLRGDPGTPLRLVRAGLVASIAGEVASMASAVLPPPGLVSAAGVVEGVGMVALSALLPWGLWRLADERVLGLDDPGQGCAARRLCGRCWKREPVRCGLHDLMIPVAIGVAVVALLPLSAPLRPILFRAEVLGAPVDWAAPVVDQLLALRLYPVVAAALSLATVPLLLRARPGALRRAEGVFFAAVGLCAYPVLRTLLASAWRESLPWADLWEELTELLVLAILAAFLVRFRAPLGLSPRER